MDTLMIIIYILGMFGVTFLAVVVLFAVFKIITKERK